MGASDDMINLKQFLVRSGSDKVNLAWICVKKYYDRMEVREGIIVSMFMIQCSKYSNYNVADPMFQRFQFQCSKYSNVPNPMFQSFQLRIVTDLMEARERERGLQPSGTCLMASSPNFNRLLHDGRANTDHFAFSLGSMLQGHNSGSLLLYQSNSHNSRNSPQSHNLYNQSNWQNLCNSLATRQLNNPNKRYCVLFF